MVISTLGTANKGPNFLNLGNAAYLKGDLEDAMKLYTQAGKSCINEEDKIHNNKALVLIKKGKYNLAKERLTEALDYNPNNGNAYYNRGIVNLITETYLQAASDLEKAQFLGVITTQNIDYQIALAYYLARDVEKAKRSLNNAIESPQDGRVSYLKGLISYASRDFATAASFFLLASEADNDPNVKYATGLAQYYGGNTKQGLNTLKELKGNKKFSSGYDLLVANLAFEAGDLKTARETYENAVKKNDKNAAAWTGLGGIALKMNDHQNASIYLEKAIKYDRHNISALNGLAHLAFVADEPKKAIITYDKVLSISPTNHKALYGKALAAMSIPDPYTCLEELAKIKKQNLNAEQVEKVVILEASALGICNKKEQAVKLLKKYRGLAKDKLKIKTMLGYYYLRMFQYGNAISNISLGQYSEALPYLIAGHASLHRGEYSGAYRYYRKAFKINPKDPDVLMGAALSMMEINMKPEALRVIDSLEVRFPKNYYVYNSKGIIYKDLALSYEKNNQGDKAKSYFDISAQAFEKAIQLRPSLKSSFDNNLGLVYFYQKDLTKAKKILNGSNRLASINNRALIDISEGNHERGIVTLDSLHKDFIRKNKVANNRVKNNLALARKRTPMNNNYKFITYYFLHQEKPPISITNPFQSTNSIIDLSIDIKPEADYILEYSDIECEDANKDRKKKKKSKTKLKFFKKKDKSKCPSFKT